jgi:hypothetical protein
LEMTAPVVYNPLCPNVNSHFQARRSENLSLNITSTRRFSAGLLNFCQAENFY